MTRPGDRPPASRTIPNPELAREMERRRRLSLADLSLEDGHELRDMRTRQVVRWLALLAVSIVVLVIAVTVFERAMLGRIGTLRAVVEDTPQVAAPAGPRLEVANGELLSALHAREDRVLNNYTWIDQSAGTVRLPIDRAIELTALRGLPPRSESAGQAPAGITLPQGSSSGRTSERLP